MNCPMVILSLGSVFSNWMMSCLAAGNIKKDSQAIQQGNVHVE